MPTHKQTLRLLKLMRHKAALARAKLLPTRLTRRLQRQALKRLLVAVMLASAEAGMAASIGGGDGAGSGDKIICTAMNEAYGFGSFRNAIWIKYSNQHLTKEHEKGYHALFLPLVDYGFKQGDGTMNKIVRKVLEWGTRHRSTDLRAEMRGKKRDTTGRIIRAIFEPLCYFVGKYK
jgi:hypothetical protein